MRKPSLSTAALSATLAIALLALSTPDHASAQRIAAALEHITVLGAKDLHSTSSNERLLHKAIIHTSNFAPGAQGGRVVVRYQHCGCAEASAKVIIIKSRQWLIRLFLILYSLGGLVRHDITGVQEVHDKMKLLGKGIKVGMIDTGVDYTHPALGGCFGKGCKVAYGVNFIGEKKGEQPKDDVMDCQGHGTHVAGIIAANDTSFIGVAPQATLGAYRVFNCGGATGNDVIIKAMIRAVEDGMDVINMSLGGPGGWRQEREARAVDILTRNSTSIFVIAMGNDGDKGVFEAASPGVSQSAITVASMEARYRSGFFFTVDPALKGASVDVEKTKTRQIIFTGDQDEDFSKKLVQLAPGTSGRVSNDGCLPITQDIRDKIVLVRRGDCTFNQKMTNVQNAGGTAVIFMDNLPNTQAFQPGLTEKFKIKYMGISMADGEYLLRVIQANNAQQQGIRLVHGQGPTSVRNKNGLFMSVFTSLGPDNELFAKPDITAPGGSIWSTYPVKVFQLVSPHTSFSQRIHIPNSLTLCHSLVSCMVFVQLGKYASLSGTSMASPYIAGCVALYLEGHPGASNKSARTLTAVRTAFQNPSRPRPNQHGYKGYASVVQQGSGLINLWSVFNNPSIASPGILALNDTANIHTQHLQITNAGKEPVTYKVDIIPAAGLVPFHTNMTINVTPRQISARPSSVKISQRLVTVAPGAKTTVDMTFAGPQTDPKLYAMYSGYIRLTPQNATSDNSTMPPVLHVPYMGMQGQYKDVPVFDKSFGLQVVNRAGVPITKSSKHRDNLLVHTSFQLLEPGYAIPHDDENNPDENDNDDDDDGDDNNEEGAVYIIYKLITGAKILVVDLVSPTGSDPRQVKSFGVIRGGVARYVPRTDAAKGNTMQVIPWDGQVVSADGKSLVAVPKGNIYRMRISLLKHFGDLENDEDFETFLSEPFTLPN
ncbi:MAG: peptidase S8/S53 domain-containing protein [Podila humilis]|nr:MAG: peptidase S8/S53 domain-containing protein [Podila humilis]